MDLITLIGKLETNLSREIVGTNYGDTVSYAASSPKTVTINSTNYLQVNRICLIVDDTTTKLYMACYDFKKLVSVNISTINSISIT